MIFFDYCYFRICQYFEDKKDKGPEESGVLLLSLLQFFIVLDLFFCLRIIFGDKFISFFNENLLEYWISPFIIFFPIKNYFRYIKYDLYLSVGKELLENESKKDRNKNNMKMWLLLSSMLFSIFLCKCLTNTVFL